VANGIIKKNTSKYSSGVSIALNQIFVGASVGFKKHLRLRGVGYKFSVNTSVNKKILITDVGFTHLLHKTIYNEMFFKFSRKFTVVRFKSKSLGKLTNFTSALRNLKKPDVYKGKGIRYLNENIIYKEGKKKKS
jgi:large subunit ribosomal protein L6